MSQIAVLGFRPHTYWTAAVALVGPAEAPRLIERRRIDFAAGDERSVYHRVETTGPDEATDWIARVWAACEADARRGIGELAHALAGAGLELGPAIVPISRGTPLDRLDDILASHSRMHAAEGDFYRGVVASACTNLGLEVRRVIERDLAPVIGARLAAEPPPLEARLKAMGAALGPPWSEDQKLATLAAWSALAP